MFVGKFIISVMDTRWVLAETEHVGNDLIGLPKPIKSVLISRDICSMADLEQFLNPPHKLPYDPLRLAGMDQALRRIYLASKQNQIVGVFGDFDVDGITGTSIIKEGLEDFGISVVAYLPDRVSEGHGLSKAAIDYFEKVGVLLLITVDCGVTSVEEVAYANQLGIDVIITDHHVPDDSIPAAAAIINPHLEGSSYPYPFLCGAGIAFKLIHGLYKFVGQPWPIKLLELAALGTIADLVPLTDENRYIVSQGLYGLATTERPGLLALYKHANVKGSQLTSETVSYQISPRLNSSGRMANAGISLDLLTTNSYDEADKLAVKLESLNNERRILSAKSYDTALQEIEREDTLHKVLFVTSPIFTTGVTGLVAGKLAEDFHRPAIALAETSVPDLLVASARSVSTFDMISALKHCETLLEKFGGHSQAAGFTVRRDNLAELTTRINELASNLVCDDGYEKIVSVDSEVRLVDMDQRCVDWLKRLEPWGIGNPQPVFMSLRVEIVDFRYMGNENQHIKFTVKQEDSSWVALAFNQRLKWSEGIQYWDIAFTIAEDSWRDGDACLKLVDFRPSF